MTYRERRLARAERLREWAEKREVRAAAVFREGERYHGDVAFNTQPGHIPDGLRALGCARDGIADDAADADALR